MALRAAVLVLTVAALLLLPAAQAHSPAFSADNRVRASIGLLNEPAVTYAVTGLDVCFTQNVATSPRPALTNVQAGNFTATLTAPDGTTHTADLAAQFGRQGCLTFSDPLVLTQPGQYLVDLAGTVNGTSFDAKAITAGGAVRDRGNHTFPASNVPSDLALHQRITALEAELASLKASGSATEDAGQFAPGAPAALLMVGLAAFVAVRRRA